MPKPRTIKPGPGAFHETQAKNLPADSKPVVIDATGLVLGRLASNVAHRLLHGDRVVVVNAEQAVITGERQSLIESYKVKREMGTDRKGPFYPRMPDQMVKRTIRGMMPYQRGNGRAAFKRLRVYIGVPEDVKASPQSIETARAHAARSLTVGEIAKALGAKF